MEKCKQCYRYDSTGQKECAVCDFQEIYIKRSKTDRAIEEMGSIDLNEYVDNTYQLVNKCIEILKRNIGE